MKTTLNGLIAINQISNHTDNDEKRMKNKCLPLLIFSPIVSALAILLVGVPHTFAYESLIDDDPFNGEVVSISGGVVSVYYDESYHKLRDPDRVTIDTAGKWTAEEILSAEPIELLAADANAVATRSDSSQTPGQIEVYHDSLSIDAFPTAQPPTEPTMAIDISQTMVDLRSSERDRPEGDTPNRGATASNDTIRTGRLFVRDPADDKNYSCSASSISTASKSLVVTAGHCVRHPDVGHNFVDITFIPGYWEDTFPYGLWTAKSVHMPVAWTSSYDIDADQAVLVVQSMFAPLIEAFGGTAPKLYDVVGSHGYTMSASAVQSNVRIWGYPGHSPYDGEKSYYCDGSTVQNTSTSSGNSLNDSVMSSCSMMIGASGGPWLINRTGPDQGTVYAVYSRGATLLSKVYAVPLGMPFALAYMAASFA